MMNTLISHCYCSNYTFQLTFLYYISPFAIYNVLVPWYIRRQTSRLVFFLWQVNSELLRSTFVPQLYIFLVGVFAYIHFRQFLASNINQATVRQWRIQIHCMNHLVKYFVTWSPIFSISYTSSIADMKIPMHCIFKWFCVFAPEPENKSCSLTRVFRSTL